MHACYVIYALGFLDLFGASLIVNAHSKYLTTLLNSPLQAGLILSLYGWLQFFASPLVGALSDSVGCQTMLTFCSFVCALGYMWQGVAASFWTLLLSRIPVGLFKFNQDLCRLLLFEVSADTGTKGVKIGYYNSISSMGFIVGPVVSGYIFEMFPTEQDATSFFYKFYACIQLFMGLFAWVVLPSFCKSKTKDGLLAAVWKSVLCARHVIVQPFLDFPWLLLWDVILLRFLASFGVQVNRSFYREQFEQRFNMSATMFGYLVSAGSVSSMLGGFTLDWLLWLINYRHHLGVGIGLAVLTCAVTASLFAPNVAFLFLLSVFFSLSIAFLRPAMLQMLLDRAGSGNVGKATGVGSSVVAVARALSPSVGALAISYSPKGPGMVAVPFLLLALLLYCTRWRSSQARKEHAE